MEMATESAAESLRQDDTPQPIGGSSPDPVATTRQTYDALASRFVEDVSGDARLRERMRRFASLLSGSGPVLDVGSGSCHDSAVLRQLGLDVISVDFSRVCLSIARDRFPGPRVQADMRRLPFRGRRVAGLWVNAALLHLPRGDVPGTLEQFRDLLVPDGVLFLSVKSGCPDGWDTKFGTDWPRWFTYWSESELDEALGRTGFSVIDSERSGHSPVTWLVRARPLPHCPKTRTLHRPCLKNIRRPFCS